MFDLERIVKEEMPFNYINTQIVEHRLKEFLSNYGDTFPSLKNPEKLIIGLTKTFAFSPFIYRLFMAHKEIVNTFFKVFEREWDREGISLENLLKTELPEEEEEFLRQARIIKYSYLAFVTSQVLTGYIDEKRFMEALSTIAAFLLQSFINREVIKLECSPPAIIAFGKLGANELNFSSDLDLCLIYPDSEEKNKKLYLKMITRLLKFFQTKTKEGFLYRIDLDLRPGGKNSPLALNKSTFVDYYLNYGTTYERYALLRARAVAGDIELGDCALKDLEKFIYRKYLDFYAFREIEELKEKIRKYRSSPGDIKQGKGGIRELEFAINTLQMIFGGKLPSLRNNSTYEAIDALVLEHIIQSNQAEFCKGAYTFLRTIENRIQMQEERQIHSLKKNYISLVAGSTGFSSLEYFKEELERVRKGVTEFFNSSFGNKKELSFEDTLTIDGAEEELNKISELDEKLAHIVAKLALRTPDPKLSVLRFYEFISKAPFKKTFVELFLSNTSTLSFLLKLFGTSRMLAVFFINHPEMIDSLVLKTYAQPVKKKEKVLQNINSQLSSTDDIEEFLDALRMFKKEEFLRIAVNDVNGVISGSDVTHQLSDLAEVVIYHCLKRAGEMVGLPQGVEVGVAAFGKLGAREIDYFSDLDLVIIFKVDKGLKNNEETAVRVIKSSQRFISFLTLPTREGKLYDVDMRLRPSGRSGPLAVECEPFLKYYREKAGAWEVAALSRSRLVAGSRELERYFYRIKKEIISLRGKEAFLSAQNYLKKFEKELSKERDDRVDIKYGRGGLKTIEFLALAGILLQESVTAEDVALTETEKLLMTLEERGILSDNEKRDLVNSYYVFSEIERKLRMMYERPVEVINREDLNKIEILLQGKTINANISDLKEMKRRVSEIYENTQKRLS